MVTAIIDSHPLFLNGLTELLQHNYENIKILRAGNVKSFRKKSGGTKPDLLIVGVNEVFDSEEMKAFEKLKKLLPCTATIIFYDELNLALPFLTTGANGFLGKKNKPEELFECIERVTKGGYFVDSEISDLISTTPPPDLVYKENQIAPESCRLSGKTARS